MFSEKKSNILFSRPSEELKASRSLWELKVKGVQGKLKDELYLSNFQSFGTFLGK